METNYIKRTCCDESKPYIFISYAHKDGSIVLEIINNLVQSGYNVWWDEGIDPGTEWDENIAEHVKKCSYFIAFISNNYINSNNCKDELNYSRDLDKEQLLVYLENCDLPSGMAMRMNRLQSVYWCNYPDKNDAFAKLYEAKGIDTAKISNEAPANWKPLEKNDLNNKGKKTGKTIAAIIASVAVIVALIVSIIFVKAKFDEEKEEKSKTEESEKKSDKKDKEDKEYEEDEDSSDDKESAKNDKETDDEDADKDSDDKPASTIVVSQSRNMFPEIIGNRADNILNSSYYSETGMKIKDSVTSDYITSLSIVDDRIYTIDNNTKKAVSYALDGTDMEYIEELSDFSFDKSTPYLLVSEDYYYCFFYISSNYMDEDEIVNGDLYCVDRKTGEILGVKEDLGYESNITFCNGYLFWIEDGDVYRCKAGDINDSGELFISGDDLDFEIYSIRNDGSNILLVGVKDYIDPAAATYSISDGEYESSWILSDYAGLSTGTPCIYDNIAYIPVSDYTSEGYLLSVDMETGDTEVLYDVEGFFWGLSILKDGDELAFCAFDMNDTVGKIVTMMTDGRGIIDIVDAWEK